jgi:hypothetical protein
MSAGIATKQPAAAVAKAQPPARLNRWGRLNTLQKLWASVYLIWVLDGLLLITSLAGVEIHRSAMKTIGKDTAPSIIAAQHIKSALADMDANAANELLGEPGKMPDAVATYEKRRVEAAAALIEAAKNIAYGDAEQKPIEAIQVGLGAYESRVQRARDLHERGDANFVYAYRDAVKVMDETLLAQADLLDRASHEVLDTEYDAQSGRSMATVVLLLLSGGFLVGVMTAIQKFLTNHTNRILNPLLLLATLVAVGFVLYTFSALGDERRDLKIAKEDAFTSINALWRARATAYSANGDESRYLLDYGHAQDHQSAFFAKVALLAKPPEFEDISDARKAAELGKLSGYLGDELKNITFPGEREAALSTLDDFVEYVRIDGMIRRLQETGKHAEAIELCIGTKMGQSNWAFDQFDQALGKTLKINQDAFDAAVGRGFDVLSGFEWKAAIVAAAIAVLAFFGLWKRIQEYQ